MGGVPSKPTDMTVEPKVIAAGYSRTGTSSMAKALEILLDGPVLHGGSALYGREDEYAKKWYRILHFRKDKPKLLKLLREATMGFVAITDTPPVLFLPELMELYPNAKVILVDRDTEKWWKSIEALMEKDTMPNWVLKILLWPCFTWRWIPYWLYEMKAFTEEQHGKDVGKALKEQHNTMVRNSVPKKQRIEMQITDGWGPLCSFLKKPVPSQPFPHENDAKAFDEAVKTIFTMAITTWAMYIVGYGAGIGGILYFLWSKGRI